MRLAKKLLRDDLKTFDQHFNTAVKSHVPLLNTILRYIANRKGKQLRPIFVLLSAALEAPPNEKTYRSAALVELLHTATLVHDDVVDKAELRRGFFSVYSLWKSKIAVLVGDYLLSKGLLLSLENKDFDILTLLSTAVKEMSEGELLQLEKSRKLNLTESEYYTIIKGKTASLLSSACASGMKSVTNDTHKIEKMQKLGENVGMAFQIRDDLFDYTQNRSGKSQGNDIEEKKLTLPLIYALSQASTSEQKKIKSLISKGKKGKNKKQEVQDFVYMYRGVDYAENKMQEFIQEAKNILSTFPHGDAQEAFEELISYVITRDK